MSPILDLQRRQRELGRIRMGDKGGKGQPQKLSEFRLTSSARHLLEHAAALWGGEVRQWAGSPSEGQWELYTKTGVLPIVIPPSAEPVSQWYEQWSAGGCTHRCDGVRNHITDSPCSCTDETRGTPAGCKATTRVNVMLPDLPDVGVWRLETHGINAAYELPGTIDVIQMASASGRFLTGRLRIEHRTSKKAGQTRKFIVPVIDLDVSMGALMSGASDPPPALDAGGEGPREDAAPAALPSGQPEPDAPVITQAQIGHLMSVARESGVSETALKPIVLRVAGVKSRKDIPKAKFDELLREVEAQNPDGALFTPERREDEA